ncbi:MULTISPECIES: aspartate aminotransferase family protein [Paraburkholderia]|uniref:Aminotransferase class III-fold pyridoxal phosphate-dependent enzyme n=1 Tax=Paraburkholderia madseniana TaxID=2599607 RepID=A0AAP5ET96_9BURK|nr:MULTISPECIES: aminotransferase class III-fold pyridoxal phosphate-dependent enzyme [Paraburkholderia]MCX4152045.1 aminotransferase class III-fold pyridoxal phosphate-dependent enzyme [Paraburkholderia madseniana]MCX4175630.1 aminotransferase class III-fold pyridoxal phosphate-dependent enzyme [Paraburkholderia madseniana]MDN7154973.1 aminotransferase class III-fold pyridoxal phosphate-dependent enzyme [Paraburkholderia sp. WS6]MDQ6413856.1 aminotransferase class III-fold pyridoxal phosphate-
MNNTTAIEVAHDLERAISSARQRLIDSRPASAAAFRRAQASMPGGNTRTVLHFDPFPLTFKRGAGSDLWDVDDACYSDFVGEFSAGLYGHSDPIIKQAIRDALDQGIVMGGPGDREVALADLVTSRFPSIEQLRFCNSGTEANILALSAAIALSGKRKILVFEGAYHGGVLAFSTPPSVLNIPWEYVYVPYNDTQGAIETIGRHADSLAAVIVEPILGAAGNIPGTASFLRALREATASAGVLLIFDEVKTSRCGAGGIQGRLGISADFTTLGKYLGGGLPCGALGGRQHFMQRFDPSAPNAFRHAGTFNNNPCTMSAGLAGLSQIFTASRADKFDAACEEIRLEFNAMFSSLDVPMRCVGQGSMFSVHFVRSEPANPSDIPRISARLMRLLHLELLLEGVVVASRGDIFVSLPVEQRHIAALKSALNGFAARWAPLLRAAV